MKKLSVLAAFVIFAIVGLSSCLSSSFTSSGTSSSSSSRVSVNLYVNAPTDDLYASATVLAYRAANSSYSGTVSISYSGTPSASAITSVASYYGYCEGIKTAIAKGHGIPCSLTFNTQADGKGTVLDFSSNQTIIKSLLMMAVYNYTSVYAIYKF